MQKTATEHAGSAYRDRTCASCHMKAGENGRRTHGFVASHDATMLANAIDVQATRQENGHLVFVLSSRDVGHAFPTGDLFRRLVLRLKTTRGVREQPFERSFRSTHDIAKGHHRVSRRATRGSRRHDVSRSTLPHRKAAARGSSSTSA